MSICAQEELAEIEADLYGQLKYNPPEDEGGRLLLKEKLAQLDVALEEMPETQKVVYLKAQKNYPSLVSDTQKSTFLWAEGFDPSLSAERLVRYWDFRHTLFGEQKCFSPLTLSGALKDDMDAVSVGLLRLLPVQDDSGRAIFFFDPSRHDSSKYSDESMLRACWYIMQVACEDPIVQQQGVVVLGCETKAKFDQLDYKLFGKIFDLLIRYVPVKWRSFHLSPSRFYHIFEPIILRLIGDRMKKRFKVHFGSEEEVLKELSKYGLSSGRIPKEMSGQMLLDYNKWLSDRWVQEQIRMFPLEAVSLRPSKEDPNPSTSDVSCSGVKKRKRDIHIDADKSLPAKADHLGNVPKPEFPSHGSKQSKQEASERSDSRNNGHPCTRNGRKGDPRMRRALEVKLANPTMSLLQALRVGGFEFPSLTSDTPHTLVSDTDNVSLLQRKNQLLRRLRIAKQKGGRELIDAEKNMETTTKGHQMENLLVYQKGGQNILNKKYSHLSSQTQQLMNGLLDLSDRTQHLINANLRRTNTAPRVKVAQSTLPVGMVKVHPNFDRWSNNNIGHHGRLGSEIKQNYGGKLDNKDGKGPSNDHVDCEADARTIVDCLNYMTGNKAVARDGSTVQNRLDPFFDAIIHLPGLEGLDVDRY